MNAGVAQDVPQYPALITHWRLFTDGAGPVQGVAPFAGWGVAIWEGSSQSPVPTVELFGPVCLTPGEERWSGAISATNNVGELTAIIEALLWLEGEAPGQPEVPATIYYDSTYAYTAITGQTKPQENQALVGQAQLVLQRIQRIRPVDFVFVKGHSGNTGNDHADQLAGRGAKGLQCSSSARWLRVERVL